MRTPAPMSSRLSDTITSSVQADCQEDVPFCGGTLTGSSHLLAALFLSLTTKTAILGDGRREPPLNLQAAALLASPVPQVYDTA